MTGITDRFKLMALTTFGVLAILPCCSSFAQAPEPHQLYIGWSTQSITPDKPVALAGQMTPRISKHMLDPVTCTALAIETRDGDKSVETAIMVSCDLVTIGGLPDEVKKILKTELPDFDLDKLLLNATHTHTAPVLGGRNRQLPEGVMTSAEYTKFAIARIVKAVVEAWNSRKPAGVSWGLGQAVVGYNRRAVYSKPIPSYFGASTAVMYGKTSQDSFLNIEGYEDHGVEMLFLWDKQSKLTGMVLNVACPAQETEQMWQLSADFWNEVRVELHKRYGSDVHIFPQCAAAGDISPHLLWRKEAEMAMLRRKGISRRQEIGLRIANAVDDVFPYVQNDIKTKVTFRHFVGEFNLPVRKVTKEEKELAEKIAKQQPEQAGRQKRIIDRYNRQKEKPYYSARVHVIRLGDIAIATNPFELFLDYGTRIKTRSKAALTFLSQLTDGRGGYLPTARAEVGGGYSAMLQSSRVGSEGGQVLVDKTLKQINKMWVSQVVKAPQLAPIKDVRKVAEALAGQKPHEIALRGSPSMATIRFAIAGENLAISADLLEMKLARSRQLWKNACLEVFASMPGDQTITRVLMAPQVGKAAATGMRIEGDKIVIDPQIRVGSTQTDRGYQLQALIPLALLKLDTSKGSIRLEFQVDALKPINARDRMALQPVTLFGSRSAYDDNSFFATVDLKKD